MAVGDDRVSALHARLAELEQRLARAERLGDLMTRSPHAAVVHAGGTIRWANDAAAALVAEPVAATIVGRQLFEFVAPESRAEAQRRIGHLLQVGSMPDAGTFTLLASDGRRVAVESHGARIQWDGAAAVHVVLWDVTARRNEATRLAWDATHDALTRLLNRPAIMGHLADLVQPTTGDVGGNDVAVVMVDLDGFKAVNDTRGHVAGDRVLAEVARVLQQVAGDLPIGRLGGDEFVVVWRPVHPGAVPELSGRLVEAVRNHANGRELPLLSASVGGAMAPAGTVGAEELLARADTAMYQAKRAGSGWVLADDPRVHPWR